MKKLERSEFDEQWKDTFEEAEVSPNPSVWSNLDRELSVAEGKENKKRVVFYQRLAAACALFALTAGSFGIYHWQQNQEQIAELNSTKELNQKKDISQQPKSNETVAIENEKERNNLIAAKNGNDIENAITPQSGISELKNEVSSSQDGISDSKNGISVSQRNISSRAKEDFTGLNKSGNNAVGDSIDKMVALNDDQKQKSENRDQISKSEVEQQNKKIDWYLSSGNDDLPLLPWDSLNGGPVFKDIIRKLPAISSAFMAERKREDIKHEKLWASVVASAGTYTDKGSSPYTASGQSSSLPSGNSYTMGMIGGTRIAKRWVLQSGVQYLSQSAGYISDIPTTNLASVSNPAAIHSGPQVHALINNSSSYDITSTNQFVTVPVQAGYLLVDKKIGWQINSGVATDLFVRNTLTDPSGQRQSYSQGGGADSPYRSVNFSGLMSSEVSYKLGKNYRVSLVPGFKYSFNPVLKSQTGNPLAWDVGFRFRYIFR